MTACQQAGSSMIGSPVVSLPSPFNHSVNNPAGAIAAIGLNNTGFTTTRTGGTTTNGAAWVLPTVYAGAAYDCMFTVTSGTVNLAGSSATGSWLSLGSTQFWGRSQGAGTSATITGTLQIRSASTLTVLASVSCTIIADGT